VENLTMSLAVEWARPFNVKVNAVAPGIIKSSGTDQYNPRMLQMAQKVLFSISISLLRLMLLPTSLLRPSPFSQNIPLHRVGTPEEVAHLIVFLASEKLASYITGQTYYITGGNDIFGDTWTYADDEDNAVTFSKKANL
jgi:citronellol/citronellal dehydrogenase